MNSLLSFINIYFITEDTEIEIKFQEISGDKSDADLGKDDEPRSQSNLGLMIDL